MQNILQFMGCHALIARVKLASSELFSLLEVDIAGEGDSSAPSIDYMQLTHLHLQMLLQIVISRPLISF